MKYDKVQCVHYEGRNCDKGNAVALGALMSA